MKAVFLTFWVGAVAFACGGGDGARTTSSDTTAVETETTAPETAIWPDTTPADEDASGGVSSLTQVSRPAHPEPEPTPDPACAVVPAPDPEPAGFVYPWQGATVAGQAYTCNACKGGLAALQGSFRVFGSEATGCDLRSPDDYSIPDPAEYAETLRVDGNTFEVHRRDANAPAARADLLFRGYYFCPEPPEATESHAGNLFFIVTDSATPAIAPGDVVEVRSPTNADADDFILAWYSDPAHPSGRCYCRLGASNPDDDAQTCTDPFAPPPCDQLQPSEVRFEDQPVGTEGRQAVTLHACDAPLEVAAITLDPYTSADFALEVGTLPVVVQPGEAMTFTVVYAPRDLSPLDASGVPIAATGRVHVTLNGAPFDVVISGVTHEDVAVVAPTAAPGIRIELWWDTPADPNPTNRAGADLDLHFAHPLAIGPDIDRDGHQDPWFDNAWDCFWANTEPNWGAFDPAAGDDPSLERDDDDGLGREVLSLAVPEDGRCYRVGVHSWTDSRFGPSRATVRIESGGHLVYDSGPVSLVLYDMWSVTELCWPLRASLGTTKVCEGTFDPCVSDARCAPGHACGPRIAHDYLNVFFQPHH